MSYYRYLERQRRYFEKKIELLDNSDHGSIIVNGCSWTKSGMIDRYTKFMTEYWKIMEEYEIRRRVRTVYPEFKIEHFSP